LINGNSVNPQTSAYGEKYSVSTNHQISQQLL